MAAGNATIALIRSAQSIEDEKDGEVRGQTGNVIQIIEKATSIVDRVTLFN